MKLNTGVPNEPASVLCARWMAAFFFAVCMTNMLHLRAYILPDPHVHTGMYLRYVSRLCKNERYVYCCSREEAAIAIQPQRHISIRPHNAAFTRSAKGREYAHEPWAGRTSTPRSLRAYRVNSSDIFTWHTHTHAQRPTSCDATAGSVESRASYSQQSMARSAGEGGWGVGVA